MKRLFKAARSGSVGEIWALLNLGVPINAKDGSGNTALHLATIYNHAATVGLLIDAGADVNVTDSDQCTPLHRAVFAKDIHIIWALAASACKDAQNKKEETPLHVAVRNNEKEHVKALLMAGAKWDVKNNKSSKPRLYGVDSTIEDLFDLC